MTAMSRRAYGYALGGLLEYRQEPPVQAETALLGVDSVPAQHPLSAPPAGYEGAVPLNALGVRIGEVRRLERDAQGRAQAVLVIGGARDVLGLFDFGGAEVRVSAERLAFGRERVAAATFANDVSAVRTDLGDASVLTAAR
jgi:hypothetical protein